MPSRRAASPAASEPELDILDSLYPGEGEEGGQNFGGDGLDFDGFLNAGAGGDGEDDDEAFIALQQAASYRKASNLKGRTVKKGGGFQAMGTRKAVHPFTKQISLTNSLLHRS
jgi:ATP-dependent RNA helicase DDX54/DBP10